MGDKGLDQLFQFFGYIFAPTLIFVLMFGLCAASWVAAVIFQQVVDGFKLANQKVIPPVTDDAAREEVFKWRALQDEARLRRVTRRAAIKRDIGNHVAPEDADLMVEMLSLKAEPEPQVLICKNPLGDKPEYFVDVLKGTAVGEGAKGLRQAKVYFTPLRNHARTMPETEARKWLAHLPYSKDLFIVPAQDTAAPVVKNKIVQAQSLPF